MSPAELKVEIEARAAGDPTLAALWADVFPPHETKRDELSHREGHLKPDAAFEIRRRLVASGSAVGDYAEVQEAKLA